jgi:K+-transporting ATPase ATPase C chain
VAAELRACFIVFLLLSLITGLAYPLVITGVAQVAMPAQANGSVIEREGKPVGSALIGQPFDDPEYFWSRPSATSPEPYNAGSSSGSNLGPTNPALIEAVTARVDALRKADIQNRSSIPVDLVTSSASGLDPHISPAAALYQISRVARARGLSQDQLQQLIDEHTTGRTLGLLGEPRVNVLAVNLSLDALRAGSRMISGEFPQIFPP